MVNDEGIPVFMLGRSEINGRTILPALQPRFDGMYGKRPARVARPRLTVSHT